MKVLLLSGLGPAFKNLSYYEGTFLAAGAATYHAGLDMRINASSLWYRMGNVDVPVLRPNQRLAPSLTTATLSCVLRRSGHDFEVFPLEDVWANSREPSWTHVDVVALSTTFICNFPTLKRAIHWVRRRFPRAILILGGQFSNIKYQLIMHEIRGVDYIVRGDGEVAFPALLEALDRGGDVSHIPNLVFRDYARNDVRCTELQYIDLDVYPSPSFDGPCQEVTYESMRGCPYSCKFCSYPAASPQWRFKSVAKIIDDWKQYANDNGARIIRAMDSTFTVPRGRFRRLLEELPRLGVAWSAYARADHITSPDIVSGLEAAGCQELSFGFESMSDASLMRMQKGATAANNYQAADVLRGSAIDYRVSFIIGYPGETPRDYEQTHRFLVDSFDGRFLLNVFSLTDETMPVWRDASQHNLRVRDARNPNFSWSHSGMSADTAFDLFLRTLREVRWKNTDAVHNLWQTQFESPLLPHMDHAHNRRVEKLIERLALVEKDYRSQPHEIRERTRTTVHGLRALGVEICDARTPRQACNQRRSRE